VARQAPAPTPFSSSDIPIGRQKVEITLEGYDAVVREIEVREGETVDLGVIDLVRQTGAVSITTTPAGVQVWQDRKLIGKSPLELERIPTGRYTYRLWLPGYDPLTFDTLVRAGETARGSLALSPSRGPRPGRDFSNTLGMPMVWVPEANAWVARFETTQNEYSKLMRTNPSAFPGDRNPVESVTWEEAVEFCRRLQQSEQGREAIASTLRYRLPTEKEWSVFVADAGLAGAVTSLNTPAKGPSPVGSGSPNRYGLHDVRGNVAEWSMDAYQGNEAMRILLGGSWSSSHAESLKTAFRDYNGIKDRGNNRGFRIVLAYEFP
jgi:hypothetical protein